MLKIKRVIKWMDVIRSYKEQEQYRILESFWESQLTSKQWIIDVIKEKDISCYGTVYIFGGWFGVLGGMLLDTFDNINTVYSIDIDSNTKVIGEQLNPDVTFVVQDMMNFTFSEQPSLVINTSTEHINQETYNTWIKSVPTSSPIILQGNNYFSCQEHIRCFEDITEFKKMNPLDSIIYEGELTCSGTTGPFTRFMTIGHKYA